MSATKQVDEIGQAALQQLSEEIGQRNDAVAKLAALGGDPQSLLESLRENSENPEVRKINDQIERVNAKLLELENKRDEIVMPEVEATLANSKDEVDALNTRIDEADAVIKAGKSYFRKVYGDNVLEGLPEVTKKPGSRAGGTRASGGGGKRVRGYRFHVGDNTFDNLAGTAKAMNVETSALQDAFFGAGGDNKPASLDFTVQVGDEQVTVRATRTEGENKAA